MQLFTRLLLLPICWINFTYGEDPLLLERAFHSSSDNDCELVEGTQGPNGRPGPPAPASNFAFGYFYSTAPGGSTITLPSNDRIFFNNEGVTNNLSFPVAGADSIGIITPGVYVITYIATLSVLDIGFAIVIHHPDGSSTTRQGSESSILNLQAPFTTSSIVGRTILPLQAGDNVTLTVLTSVGTIKTTTASTNYASILIEQLN